MDFSKNVAILVQQFYKCNIIMQKVNDRGTRVRCRAKELSLQTFFKGNTVLIFLNIYIKEREVYNLSKCGYITLFLIKILEVASISSFSNSMSSVPQESRVSSPGVREPLSPGSMGRWGEPVVGSLAGAPNLLQFPSALQCKCYHFLSISSCALMCGYILSTMRARCKHSLEE